MQPADRAEGAGQKTAMLNKDVLCGGVSVGAEFTIRIVADHGNEVEVECVGGGESKESPEKPEEQSKGDMTSLLED